MDRTDDYDDIWSGFDRFFERGIEDMNKKISDMFGGLDSDNSQVRTYGYTMYRGPDGVPHVKEFGNSDIGPGIPAELTAGKTREPLTDVNREGDIVRTVAEIPGVNKNDILLDASRDSISIRVNTPKRKYSKALTMPCRIDPDSAQASYNNGILEITVKAVGPEGDSKRVSIE